MAKLKRYFGNYNMTWLRVLVFAVIAAVVTALLNEVTFLENTSFADIAVFPDWWLLFGLFIAVNCKKWWEATLKCFVFFLVSQPLIFLIEVPFEPLGWQIFGYYGPWFIATLFTLPAGAAAFFVKKKNWLSVVILAVASVYYGFMSVQYFEMTARSFPRHLLSGVFCIAAAVFLIFVLFDGKKKRLASLGVLAAAIAVSVLLVLANSGAEKELFIGEGKWICETKNDPVVTVEMKDDENAVIKSLQNGATIVDFRSSDGKVKSFNIVADGKNLMIALID